MATGGSIIVHLIARTEAFAKGMDASKQRIAMLEKATASTMMIVRRFGMIASGIAVGGMTLLVKKSMENIDTIAKLSDRIGVSTEFLSAFGHAAKIAGSSSEAFNKSIEMFVRRMGETTAGTGEAKRGMESLGLTTQDLLNVSTEDAFLRVADGIRGLGTQAEKAAAAYQFFGRSGSQMLNLLESDLSGVIAEAERLGITFNRQMAADIERANDAVARMKASFQGIANTIAIALSPIIEFIAEQIADLISGSHGVERVEAAIRNIAVATSYLHDAFLLVKGVVEGIFGVMLRMMAIALIVPAEISKLIGMGGLADTLDAIGKGFWDVGGEMFSDNSIRSIGKARAEMERFFNEVDRRRSDYIAPTPSFGGYEEPEEIGKSLGPASAMEITRNVSVAGLSMGGMVDKQDTTNNLLQTQNQILRELQSRLAMN